MLCTLVLGTVARVSTINRENGGISWRGKADKSKLGLIVLACKCVREGSHVNWGYWFGQVNRSLKFLDKETKNQKGRPPEECTLVIDSPLPPLVLGESLN